MNCFLYVTKLTTTLITTPPSQPVQYLLCIATMAEPSSAGGGVEGGADSLGDPDVKIILLGDSAVGKVRSMCVCVCVGSPRVGA